MADDITLEEENYEPDAEPEDDYEPDAAEIEDEPEAEEEADPSDYEEPFDEDELGRLLDDVPEAEDDGEPEPEEEAEEEEYEPLDDDEMEQILDDVTEGEPDYDDEDDPEEQEVVPDGDIDYTSREFVDEDGLNFFLENLRTVFFERFTPYCVDLDDATETGSYKYTNESVNRPTGTSTGGTCFVWKWSDTYSYQIACPNHAAQKISLWARLKSSSGWGRWTKFQTDTSEDHYQHEQGTAASTWNITHNLGYYPSVTVVDSSNNVVEGSVSYVSANELNIDFVGSFAGKAYLN